MNVKEVKIYLIKNGLNIADMARKLEPSSDASFKSLQTMLSDLLYGRRWFPSLARDVEREFGLRIDKPQSYRTVKEQIRQAA